MYPSNGSVESSGQVRHTIQKSQCGCEWFGRLKKCIGEVPIHFQLELNTPGILSVPVKD